MSRFQFTAKASDDLDEIWWFLADNRETANRVEAEILDVCSRLAHSPLIGRSRPEIAPMIRSWSVSKFPNYVILYRPDVTPLLVVAVFHGKRNLKEAFRERLV